eukprot:284580_1
MTNRKSNRSIIMSGWSASLNRWSSSTTSRTFASRRSIWASETTRWDSCWGRSLVSCPPRTPPAVGASVDLDQLFPADSPSSPDSLPPGPGGHGGLAGYPRISDTWSDPSPVGRRVSDLAGSGIGWGFSALDALNLQDSPQRPRPFRVVQCKYEYRPGGCPRGDNCTFKHTKAPYDPVFPAPGSPLGLAVEAGGGIGPAGQSALLNGGAASNLDFLQSLQRGDDDIRLRQARCSHSNMLCPLPHNQSSALCKHWNKLSGCQYRGGLCRFVHRCNNCDSYEHGYFSCTEPCRKYEMGTCPYGSRCFLRHAFRRSDPAALLPNAAGASSVLGGASGMLGGGMLGGVSNMLGGGSGLLGGTPGLLGGTPGLLGGTSNLLGGATGLLGDSSAILGGGTSSVLRGNANSFLASSDGFLGGSASSGGFLGGSASTSLLNFSNGAASSGGFLGGVASSGGFLDSEMPTQMLPEAQADAVSRIPASRSATIEPPGPPLSGPATSDLLSGAGGPTTSSAALATSASGDDPPGPGEVRKWY